MGLRLYLGCSIIFDALLMFDIAVVLQPALCLQGLLTGCTDYTHVMRSNMLLRYLLTDLVDAPCIFRNYLLLRMGHWRPFNAKVISAKTFPLFFYLKHLQIYIRKIGFFVQGKKLLTHSSDSLFKKKN